MNTRRRVLMIGSVAVGLAVVLGSVSALSALADPAEPSALEDYPGFRVANAAMDDAAFAREDIARQNLVRDCMAAKGMPYSPVFAVTVDADEVDAIEVQDPNDQYASGLPGAQRTEYYLALYGMADPNAPVQPELGGCLGQAHAQIEGVFALRSKLNQELMLAYEQVDADVRVTTAESAWRKCMARAGFAYTSREDLLTAAEFGRKADTVASAFDRRSCAAPLTQVRVAVQQRVEDDFVEQHRQELESFTRSWKASAALVSEHQ